MNCFHKQSLCRILGTRWRDKVPNAQVLAHASLPTMYTLLRQRKLRWLGHVRRMEDDKISKDIFYRQLASGKRPQGRPSWDINKSASATSKLQTSIQRSGRTLWQTSAAGAACLRNCWRQVRRRSRTWEKEESQAEGTETPTPPPPPPHDELHLFSSSNTTISHGTLLGQNKSA